VLVVRPGEQRRELDLVEVPPQAIEAGGELRRELGIRLLLEELVGRLEVLQRPLEPFVAVDPIAEPGEPLGQLLTASGVIPDRRIRGLPFQLGDLRSGALDVKGTPSRS
jgi:hypothetical protein